jgi:hypothetical protein
LTNRVGLILVALLLPLLVITGCGPSSTNASASPTAAESAALPSDPSGNQTDAQPIDQSCPTSNTKSFAKTKFVLHAGLAFGAFHRYLYKPYQAGTFNKGAKGRITAFVKGGLAALFVKREVRLASEDVKASPALCKAIAAPLAKIGNTAQAAFDKLKSGDTSGLTDMNSAVSSVESASSRNGAAITENDNPNLAATPQ